MTKYGGCQTYTLRRNPNLPPELWSAVKSAIIVWNARVGYTDGTDTLKVPKLDTTASGGTDIRLDSNSVSGAWGGRTNAGGLNTPPAYMEFCRNLSVGCTLLKGGSATDAALHEVSHMFGLVGGLHGNEAVHPTCESSLSGESVLSGTYCLLEVESIRARYGSRRTAIPRSIVETSNEVQSFWSADVLTSVVVNTPAVNVTPGPASVQVLHAVFVRPDGSTYQVPRAELSFTWVTDNASIASVQATGNGTATITKGSGSGTTRVRAMVGPLTGHRFVGAVVDNFGGVVSVSVDAPPPPPPPQPVPVPTVISSNLPAQVVARTPIRITVGLRDPAPADVVTRWQISSPRHAVPIDATVSGLSYTENPPSASYGSYFMTVKVTAGDGPANNRRWGPSKSFTTKVVPGSPF